MNTKVQEFIIKMKEEEKKQRDDMLISLGLFDYAIDKNKRRTKCPIEVTDEEYQEILKYSNFKKIEKIEKIETKNANKIKYFSTYFVSIYAISLTIMTIVFCFNIPAEVAFVVFIIAFALVIIPSFVFYLAILNGYSKIVESAEIYTKRIAEDNSN